jgi:hypothetical protein
MDVLCGREIGGPMFVYGDEYAGRLAKGSVP